MDIAITAHTIPQSGVWGMGIGTSRNMYNLGVGLKNLGNNVTLFVRDDFKPSENWVVPVKSPKFSWIVYPLYLSKYIKNISADVFISDYVTTGAPFVWNKKHPSIISIYDVIPFSYKISDLSLKDLIITSWYRYCFSVIKKADVLLVLSNFAKREAMKLGIDQDKISVVYQGCDGNIFYPLKKENHDTIKIGYLGGLDGRKNVVMLVESFKKLRSLYGKKIELHVAGGGNNLERFRKMNIDGAKFYGFIKQDNVVKFYNSLDIFVFPSLNEGFGNMIAEAMHCGLPIIGCNAGTSPELIGKYGIIVEPTIESMIKGIATLIEDKCLRSKLSKLSLERAKTFTYENCSKDILKICRNVVENK